MHISVESMARTPLALAIFTMLTQSQWRGMVSIVFYAAGVSSFEMVAGGSSEAFGATTETCVGRNIEEM